VVEVGPPRLRRRRLRGLPAGRLMTPGRRPVDHEAPSDERGRGWAGSPSYKRPPAGPSSGRGWMSPSSPAPALREAGAGPQRPGPAARPDGPPRGATGRPRRDVGSSRPAAPRPGRSPGRCPPPRAYRRGCRGRCPRPSSRGLQPAPRMASVSAPDRSDGRTPAVVASVRRRLDPASAIPPGPGSPARPSERPGSPRRPEPSTPVTVQDGVPPIIC
jgi:hypothetical protein